MQSKTVSTPARGLKHRWLIPLLVALLVFHFLTQLIVIDEVWTPDGEFNNFEGTQPYQVTTRVSVAAFGHSWALPVFTRGGEKNPNFE